MRMRASTTTAPTASTITELQSSSAISMRLDQRRDPEDRVRGARIVGLRPTAVAVEEGEGSAASAPCRPRPDR